MERFHRHAPSLTKTLQGSVARLSKKIPSPQIRDLGPREKGWPGPGSRTGSVSLQSINRSHLAFPLPWFSKFGPGNTGGRGRGFLETFPGTLHGQNHFHNQIQFNLPLPLSFSCDCRMEFSRGYLICAITRTNEGRSRNENPALLLSPIGKRLAKATK